MVVTQVLVESIIPLNSDEKSNLVALLTQKLGQVTLKEKLNLNLLGGLKLTFNGQVVDLSLSTRLNQINKNLLKYGNL